MKTIADIKQEYPQYRNVPDVKLAGALYKKYYSDKDEDEFYKLVFPNIAEKKDLSLDQTLSPEVDEIISPDDEMFNQERIQNINYKPSVKDIAIENDIGTETGANPEARFALSLGYDEKNKALAIKNVLSDLYKTNITVRTGTNTGELEFLNPETKKFEFIFAPSKVLLILLATTSAFITASSAVETAISLPLKNLPLTKFVVALITLAAPTPKTAEPADTPAATNALFNKSSLDTSLLIPYNSLPKIYFEYSITPAVKEPTAIPAGRLPPE